MWNSPTGPWPSNDPDHPVVDVWRCPACDAAVEHPRRPGRRRIYCRNACRQRAYRWRRRNQILTVHTNAAPVERASSTLLMRHALRTERDPASRPSYGPQREELTVCGVLARPFRFSAAPSYGFLTNEWTCRTCMSLTFAEPSPPYTNPPRWRIPLRLRDDSRAAGPAPGPAT